MTEIYRSHIDYIYKYLLKNLRYSKWRLTVICGQCFTLISIAHHSVLLLYWSISQALTQDFIVNWPVWFMSVRNFHLGKHSSTCYNHLENISYTYKHTQTRTLSLSHNEHRSNLVTRIFLNWSSNGHTISHWRDIDLLPTIDQISEYT